MSPIVQGIIIGVSIGVVMLIINIIVLKFSNRSKAMETNKTNIQANKQQIEQNKKEICETKDLIKQNIRLSMIIGDGLIELGVNGNVKKALQQFKNDIVDSL